MSYNEWIVRTMATILRYAIANHRKNPATRESLLAKSILIAIPSISSILIQDIPIGDA